MRDSKKRVRALAAFAVSAFGVCLAGCDRPSHQEVSALPGTVNLWSLPGAEVFVDGRPCGTTPLALSLAAGRHEVVFRQEGFGDYRETLEVRSGGVGSIDTMLDPIDQTDPETIRRFALAYGVTVDRSTPAAIHRGGSFDGGIALLFPRDDVRKEGLASCRLDVTPAYDGTGWLEFRKGKTSLHRERFNPETLSTMRSIPSSVSDSLRVGDAVTWGVWFDDGRKPITARFEVVSKPAAQKKLAEISADKRWKKDRSPLRALLEAEVLQTYRLYSESLVKLLAVRDQFGDAARPWNGIVACLRRLDLEDSALFQETVANSTGKGVTATGNPIALASPTPRMNRPIPTPAPTPGAGPADGGTQPPAAPPTTPPATPPSGTTPPSGSPAGLARLAADARLAAEQAAAASARAEGVAQQATQTATDARAASDAANGALAAARTAAEANPSDPAAQEALGAAERNAEAAQRAADDAARGAAEASARADAARRASEQAARRAQQAETGSQPPTNGGSAPTMPTNGGSPVRPSPRPMPPAIPGAPVAPPASPLPSAALETARANLVTLHLAVDTARIAALAAEEAAAADPSDDAKRAAADQARTAHEEAQRVANEAAQSVADLESTGG